VDKDLSLTEEKMEMKEEAEKDRSASPAIRGDINVTKKEFDFIFVIHIISISISIQKNNFHQDLDGENDHLSDF
jgi:hypothetical protein